MNECTFDSFQGSNLRLKGLWGGGAGRQSITRKIILKPWTVFHQKPQKVLLMLMSIPCLIKGEERDKILWELETQIEAGLTWASLAQTRVEQEGWHQYALSFIGAWLFKLAYSFSMFSGVFMWSRYLTHICWQNGFHSVQLEMTKWPQQNTQHLYKWKNLAGYTWLGLSFLTVPRGGFIMKWTKT